MVGAHAGTCIPTCYLPTYYACPRSDILNSMSSAGTYLGTYFLASLSRGRRGVPTTRLQTVMRQYYQALPSISFKWLEIVDGLLSNPYAVPNYFLRWYLLPIVVDRAVLSGSRVGMLGRYCNRN